jgi:hypothetical protein
MSPVRLAIDIAPFHHAEKGMTRFPPNVEQITVDVQGQTVWLIARRNDVELRFPLSREDALHLATLLAEG